MRIHLDRDRDEPFLWEESVVLDPAALDRDLILDLSPIDVRGRLDRIEIDEGAGGRGGAVQRSRAAAAAGPASFQVGMDLRYSQALACTRCLGPVRSEVSAHVDLMVATRPQPAHRRASPSQREGGAAMAQTGPAARSGSAANPGSASQAAKKGAKAAKAGDSGGPSGSRRRGDRAAAAGDGVELEKDELGALLIDGEYLDTEPLIAEHVLLEVPMKPLCGPDCRGLCPRCGADRNVTPDCCPETAGDERWEALAALRDRLPADGE